MSRIRIVVPLAMALLPPVVAACSNIQPSADPTLQLASDRAVVALYSDEGTWPESVQAIEEMFRWMDYGIERVDASVINREELDVFLVLVLPGGDMYQHAQDVSPTGMDNMRDFVLAGGGYIGVCGRAYSASEEVVWQGRALVPGARNNAAI